MTEVHLQCVYIYEDSSGKEQTDEYVSTNGAANTSDPLEMMEILTKEIEGSTGRKVKSFIMFGKFLVGEEESIKIIRN